MNLLLRSTNLRKQVKTSLQQQLWARLIIWASKAVCELLARCRTPLEFGCPHQRNRSNCLVFQNTFQSPNTLCERRLILTPRRTRSHDRLRLNRAELSPSLSYTNNHLLHVRLGGRQLLPCPTPIRRRPLNRIAARRPSHYNPRATTKAGTPNLKSASWHLSLLQ